MIRTRRGTRRREVDKSGSSQILLPYSKDTSGTLLLLLLLEVYENGMGIVNDLRGVSGGPFIG